MSFIVTIGYAIRVSSSCILGDVIFFAFHNAECDQLDCSVAAGVQWSALSHNSFQIDGFSLMLPLGSKG